MDNLISFALAAGIIIAFLLLHFRKMKKQEEKARAALEKGKFHSEGPRAQHPQIDANYCIGCAACTLVCPEGDVLAMLGGKAVIVNGYKCIGHSLCAEVCPVGAIKMVMASPSVGADLPFLSPEHETSIKNLFIVGELSGLALIKNTINQGRDCVDFRFRKSEKVEAIAKGPDGIFMANSTKGSHRARAVILAIGKSGSPRKLGVKGEDLPKVMYRLIEADHYVHKRILVVGGGDSAVEAAMGLAHQVGNTVTLSYRQAAFGLIKERNTRRLGESVRNGKLKVIFNSNPVEFTPDAVMLEVKGLVQKLPNDYVWIFAGGEPPTAFLKKIGITFGPTDLTSEGSKQVRELELVQA